jgi:hypothetical protein
MYTDIRVGDTTHNDHGNSSAKEIRQVTRENRSKLKPGEPVDIIGTGSNYEESDLIAAPEQVVDRLKDEE